MKGILSISIILLVLCSFTPPGTVKVKKGFYMDKGEITISDWMEFIYYMKQTPKKYNSQVIEAAKPDSVILYQTYHAVILKHSPKYDNFPVVGISYEQAMDYCKWRSEVVTFKYHRKIEYRLPTESEWLAFATKKSQASGTQIDTLQPYNYPFHSKKVAYLGDNVSEMIAEKGVALGNNFTDKTKGLEKHTYAKPEKWLGFRCACDVTI